MRRDFVANVSHELKTPLTVIMGNSELLLNTDIEKKQQKVLLQATLEQTQRMNALITDLISLSSIDSTKNIQRNNEVIVEDLKDQIINNLSSLKEKKGIFDKASVRQRERN